MPNRQSSTNLRALEDRELRVAGTRQSLRPVCDACILIWATDAALVEARLGPDDMTLLEDARRWAYECSAFAWGHGLVALVENSSGHPLGGYECSSVMAAALQGAGDPEVERHPHSRVLGFEGLFDDTQGEVLSYARGILTALPELPHPDDSPDPEHDPTAQLVLTALDHTPSVHDTVKAQFEESPRAQEAFGWFDAIQRLRDREGVQPAS